MTDHDELGFLPQHEVEARDEKRRDDTARWAECFPMIGWLTSPRRTMQDEDRQMLRDDARAHEARDDARYKYD